MSATRPTHSSAVVDRGSFHWMRKRLRAALRRKSLCNDRPIHSFHEPGVERDRVGLLPLPARNERGEGRGEGKSNKDGLLSPPARPKPRRCFGLRTRQAPLPLGRPKPLRRGEGPALSSFVPQEEREKSSVHGPKACAKAKEGSL